MGNPARCVREPRLRVRCVRLSLSQAGRPPCLAAFGPAHRERPLCCGSGTAVSYTHLDVYKRQARGLAEYLAVAHHHRVGAKDHGHTCVFLCEHFLHDGAGLAFGQLFGGFRRVVQQIGLKAFVNQMCIRDRYCTPKIGVIPAASAYTIKWTVPALGARKRKASK